MGWKDSGWKEFTLLNALCAAAPATTVSSDTAAGKGLLTGLSQFGTCVVDAKLTGPTGGAMDVYIQSSVDAAQDGSGSWYDVIHFPQVGAAATARYIASISRGWQRLAAAPSLVNFTDGTPALTVNTTVPDGLGVALRVVIVTGAGVSVGATQLIKIGLAQ